MSKNPNFIHFSENWFQRSEGLWLCCHLNFQLLDISRTRFPAVRTTHSTGTTSLPITFYIGVLHLGTVVHTWRTPDGFRRCCSADFIPILVNTPTLVAIALCITVAPVRFAEINRHHGCRLAIEHGFCKLLNTFCLNRSCSVELRK